MSTDKELADWAGRLARDCGGFERHTETDYVTRVDYVFTQECLLKFVRAVQCHEPASAALQELRLSIEKWWSKHQYDTTEDRGEWNVYDEEPEFVQLARAAMPTADERKDAARYRHLRNDWWFSSLAKYRKEIACAHDVEALDEAIDAAIAEKGERNADN